MKYVVRCDYVNYLNGCDHQIIPFDNLILLTFAAQTSQLNLLTNLLWAWNVLLKWQLSLVHQLISISPSFSGWFSIMVVRCVYHHHRCFNAWFHQGTDILYLLLHRIFFDLKTSLALRKSDRDCFLVALTHAISLYMRIPADILGNEKPKFKKLFWFAHFYYIK